MQRRKFMTCLDSTGARFTKHLKPKNLVIALQTVWNLEDLWLKMVSET